MSIFRVIYHGLVLSRGTFSTINAIRETASDAPHESLRELYTISRHCAAAMNVKKLDDERHRLLRDILQEVTDAIQDIETHYCK